MKTSTQWTAYWVAGGAALASDFTWMALSPFYKKVFLSSSRRFLSLLGVLFFWRYLKKSPWAYRYSPHYAIGTGVVTGGLYHGSGESTEFYGQYALPMNIAEIGMLTSSAALLVVYVLPAVRAHFRAAQTNKTMEPTR